MPTESFFTQASLAYLASAGAGKDGKTYSMKPTDGTGDFTFSRGSNLSATRVGADGLIEKGRENLLLHSNSFTTSPWLQTDATATIGQSGYDGTNNAWLIDKSGANGRIRQLVSATGVVTTSIYAKAGTNNWLRISFAKFAFFDLANGVIGNTNAIDTTITSVGNGWYRCTMTANPTSAQFANYYPAEDDNVISGTSGNIIMQSIQVEQGLAATEYIESGASTGKAGLLEDEPRFDYSGDCPSLLLEPSRTNLLFNSEYFGLYSFSDTAIINNDTTSPEGLQNATKIYPTASGNYRHIKWNPLNPSTGVHTYSIFAKAGELDHLVLIDYDGSGSGVDFNLSTGVATDNSSTPFDFVDMVDYGNGWYRCIATATNPYFYWILSDNGGLYVTSNGTDGLYIYGAQAEAASYPTSYIPNHSGGSVTRGADFPVKIANSSSISGSNAGTIFVEFNVDNIVGQTNNPIVITLKDASNSSQAYIRLRNDGKLESVYLLAVGGTQASITQAAGSISTGTHKVAFAFNNNDFVMYVDGSLVGSDTDGSTTDEFDEVYLGYLSSNFNPSAGIKQTLVFKTRLSNADLATLTTI